ncbi:DMT family transporter [Ktedonospora formicarum]|uniref:Membrane protein n=1 Tax=Ktedonospora formicarum TaxID=2778364 RepID=A0A8J3HZW1_9CHLR|nr:EamA family transporter [Ktedonospora formicarum]GHO46236.1 membrane protein [Ktedonospora formicarum]
MRSQGSFQRDFWFIVAASVAWGTVGVANQAIYAHTATNALSLAFFRLAIAAPLFLIACLRLLGRRFLSIKLRDLGVMVLMGAMQALYQASYSAAIAYSGVTISTLIALCVAPIIVVLCSTFLMHERPTRSTLLALLCAFFGTILLVVSRTDPQQGNFSLVGIGLALLSATGYAAFILFGRLFTTSYHSVQINFVAFGTGALILLAFALPGGLVATYPTGDWLLLFYLGSIPTALAYGLFQAGMRSVSATAASIITLFEPLTAALLAWLLFHEQLGPFGILGGLLLVGALLLLAYKK